MNKIIINENNLIPDNTWQYYKKVRAVVVNEMNEFLITIEGNKVIFPGGKCEKEEDTSRAIIRELQEETGNDFSEEEIKEALELECIYNNYYDYRISSNVKRQINTTYFCIKTNKKLNLANQKLTKQEKDEKFEIRFIKREELKRLIDIDHSESRNGKFFDDENKIVFENIIKYI